MDTRAYLNAQIAAAEQEQRQHEAMAQQSRDSALVCVGVIHGAKLLLAQLDKDEAASAPEVKPSDTPAPEPSKEVLDAAHQNTSDYIPDSDLDYHG